MSVSKGKYRARAKSAALGRTGSGKDQVGVDFEIVTKSHAGERVPWYGFFHTPEAKTRTFESLEYCGWKGDLSDLSDVTTNEVEIVVEEDTYNGETTAKVRWVNKLGGLAMKERFDESATKTFAESMKADIAAFKSGLKPARSARTGGGPGGREPPPPSDDDIPF